MRKTNVVSHRSDGVSVLTVFCKRRSYECLLDTSDYNLVKGHYWRGFENRRVIYAATTISTPGERRTTLLMHRLILQDTKLIDHENFNGLDNRRSNLRPLSPSESVVHTRKREKTLSKFRGVNVDRRRGTFSARIRKSGIEYHLGVFKSEKEAALAYDIAAIRYHGKLAYQNFSGDK